MNQATRGARCWLLVLLTVAHGCSLVRGRSSDHWEARELVQHPLVGTIWDVAARKEIDPATLLDRLASDVYVLLGDKHDNPDHHRLQARILSGLVARGRRPAVAFEPMTVDRSGALAEVLVLHSPTPERVIEAVARSDQNWPWRLYAPVIAEALRANLPIVAADLDPAWVRQLHMSGVAGLDPALRAALGLSVELPPAGRSQLEEDIRRSHCGHAVAQIAERMIDAQRARDAQLARALLDAGADGAVLIAGNGHVRRGIDVPLYLAHSAPSASVASVGLLEVSPDHASFDAALASEGTAPFDYVWFTPRVDLDDPCERFREQLRKMHVLHDTGG
jgi:uncharacterized iron-regulated protein